MSISVILKNFLKWSSCLYIKSIPLPTYADNLALPAVSRRCYSSWLMSLTCQAHSSKLTARRCSRRMDIWADTRAFQFGQKKFRFDSILAIESIFSIRFGNLINLPLVHWYSNSKLGVIFIVHNCFCQCSTQYSLQLFACIVVYFN